MEESALIRIVVAERANILAFIRSLVRQRHLAEDVLQDVFVTAVEKSRSIQDETHLKKWLRTTARMKVMGLMRNRRRHAEPVDDRLLDSLESAWDQEVVEDIALELSALQDCIQALGPSARELVHKRYTQGIGYPELAEMLNRSVKGLYVTFCRIHVALADCISNRLESTSE